jgi:hypothetical protein
MLPPALLCRNHLLGEHKELHMLAGSIARNKSILGWLMKEQVFPWLVVPRHKEIKKEMRFRGYNHYSELYNKDYGQYLINHKQYMEIKVFQRYFDLQKVQIFNKRDLADRCPACWNNIMEGLIKRGEKNANICKGGRAGHKYTGSGKSVGLPPGYHPGSKPVVTGNPDQARG